MKIYKNLFNQIVSPENLLISWDEFKKGKRYKPDVLDFEWNLEENIFKLHGELIDRSYKHSDYVSFFINDPKRRHIHKASVRDRVLHHAVFKILNPVFEPSFIHTSFSCRINKGTHKATITLSKMLTKVSKNNTNKCFVLKCDIKKFFDTVNQEILKNIISKRVKDKDTLWLLDRIIEGYSTKFSTLLDRRGIPIGNLTSQLFANVYMNELDQFVKHVLKVKHYVRCTDDFVIVHGDVKYLKNLISQIAIFLKNELDISLHSRKVTINKAGRGVDFLGYVILPNHKAVRTKTKNRAFKKLKLKVKDTKNDKISEDLLEQTLNSYLGVFSHANTYKLSEEFKNQYWFWLNE